MSAPITVLRDTHPLPVLVACKWEKLEGDPHTVNLNAYTSEDGIKHGQGMGIAKHGNWRRHKNSGDGQGTNLTLTGTGLWQMPGSDPQ